jgi:tetratricopeptide (TPR) repeat protein
MKLLLNPCHLLADKPEWIFQEGIVAEYGEGDLNKAIQIYEKALQTGFEDRELEAKTLLRLAICYERASRYEDAKNIYQQIISRFPMQIQILDKAVRRFQKLASGLKGDGYWFRYKGNYIYLIGAGTGSIYAGSGLTPDMPVTNDPVRDWRNYIDLLVQHGVNFVRFHPWEFLNRSQMPNYACPWSITNDKPTYDLDRFNPGYWNKLKEIISYANTKDVFFEIAIFDDDAPWDRHPFNIKNGGSLGDKSEYHNLRNTKNREHQEKYIQKTIDETVRYPNVIYEICDGLGWDGEDLSEDMKDWVSYWIELMKKNIPAYSAHSVTVSQESWSLGGKLGELWILPEIDIISVQESDGTEFALGKGYTRENFMKYWQKNYQKPIMINEISFGDMKGHPEGGTRGWAEERQHFWVAFITGGHATRSDFQPFSYTYPSLESCGNLAGFVRQVDFWKMNPLGNFVLECDGECYGLGSDEEFVIYIRKKTQKGDGKIKLKLPDRHYGARWYDPIKGDFITETEALESGITELQLIKSNGEMVLLIKETKGGD